MQEMICTRFRRYGRCTNIYLAGYETVLRGATWTVMLRMRMPHHMTGVAKVGHQRRKRGRQDYAGAERPSGML